jgi:hypothetical protein
MNRWSLLGVALGVVLAAAIAYSLLGDAHGTDPTPVTPSPGERPRSAVDRPGDLPTRREAPDEPDAPGELEAAAPRPDGEPWRTVEPTITGDTPPPPLAESPFVTEHSEEIDYAFRLVFGPDAGVDHARAAIDVFDRCLKASPQNRRCYDGLVAAQQRLEPGWQPPAPPQPLAPPRAAPPPPPRGVPSDEPVRAPVPGTRPKDPRPKESRETTGGASPDAPPR